MRTVRKKNYITIKTLSYHLRFDKLNNPYVKVFSNWKLLAQISILSSLNSEQQKDKISDEYEIEIEEEKRLIRVKITAQSSIWGKVEYYFFCREEYFEYYYIIEGTGKLDELFYFARYDNNGEYRGSVHHFPLVFSPEPNMQDTRYYKSWESTSIDMITGDNWDKGHWLFAPPPLCYCLRFTKRNWVSAGIAASDGECNFLEYKFNGGREFSFSLTYNNNYNIDGKFETPHIIFTFRNIDEYISLSRYVDLLKRIGYLKQTDKTTFRWWNTPIFCGWGEQVVQGKMKNKKPQDFSKQKFYEWMLNILEENSIDPRILIIDDKWQKNYGLNDIDTDKWPDLKGFIDTQHLIGRKVLLWYPLWLTEGVPEDECILIDGKPVAVDVTHPNFEKRIENICKKLLSDTEEGINADGFKIDFNDRFPKDKNLKLCGNIYGIEMLKRYLKTVYRHAKKIKKDALIITHTANPYFADVTDMIRLNDIHPGTRRLFSVMEHRQKIAKAAIPGILIDTDNFSGPSLKEWRIYTKKQAVLGVPSLYFITHIDGTLEKFRKEDYKLIKRMWARYHKVD